MNTILGIWSVHTNTQRNELFRWNSSSALPKTEPKTIEKYDWKESLAEFRDRNTEKRFDAERKGREKKKKYI